MASQSEKKEINSFIDYFSIKDEEKMEEGENLALMNTKILLEKTQKSICEIINDKGYGTGFLCKIQYPNKFKGIYCLINNKNIKLSLNLYRRIWINEEIDFTCIEILNEDNIIEIINTLEIDDNCYNIDYNIEEYDKKSIIIPSIGIKKEIELKQSIIQYIKNEKYKKLFFYNCNKETGFSGGPIILKKILKL